MTGPDRNDREQQARFVRALAALEPGERIALLALVETIALRRAAAEGHAAPAEP